MSGLTLEPLRWALALDPEWIALEQVPQVLPLWQAYADALRSRGYSVATANVQAEQYGVPQTRKRAVLVASRECDAALPTPTHSRYYPHKPDQLDEGVEKWVSMAEAARDGRRGLPVRLGREPCASTQAVLDQPAPTVTSHVDRNFWVVSTGQNSRQGGGMTKRYTRDVDLPAPTKQYQQVGNAVPPLLAAHILQALGVIR